MESKSSKNSRRVMLLAGPVLLLGLVLLLVPSCGPSPRKPFVGVWRLDAKYFKEQLEKQEFKSDDAKAASEQNTPLWESFKVELVFSPEGRYQMSTQLHDSKVTTTRGRYEVPQAATQTIQLFADDQKEPTNFIYRFVDANTLELDTDIAPPGYPKTTRYTRAESEEMNNQANKKAAP
jgi:hypothetical protein